MFNRSNKIYKKFYNTFAYSDLTDEWRDELGRYIVDGLPPGSFHTALLSNDLAQAACSSHPMNQWSNICAFMKWLIQNAPRGSWGSIENVNAWLALSPDDRRDKCEKAGILASAWELLQEP